MISNDELAKHTPVRPPIVNRKINPKVHSIEVVYLIFDP
jgi:hypothetical protein